MTDSYHGYSDYSRGNYSPSARYQNMSASYSNFDKDIIRYSYRERDLLNKLELKSEENYKLRIDLENEIKAKESLILDLNQADSELDYLNKRWIEREQSLNSKIRIIEIEKNLLEERLHFRDSRNELIKGQSLPDKKMETVVRFLNNVQKLLIDPLDQQILTPDNLTENVLNEKLNLIEAEIQKLNASNPKNNLDNKELINFKLKELKEDNEKLR
jgi:hypothetical protein